MDSMEVQMSRHPSEQIHSSYRNKFNDISVYRLSFTGNHGFGSLPYTRGLYCVTKGFVQANNNSLVLANACCQLQMCGHQYLQTQSYEDKWMYVPSFGCCFRKCLRRLGYPCLVPCLVVDCPTPMCYVCVSLKLAVRCVCDQQNLKQCKFCGDVCSQAVSLEDLPLWSAQRESLSLQRFANMVDGLAGVLYRRSICLNKSDFFELRTDVNSKPLRG